jgi:multidrug efflux pump
MTLITTDRRARILLAGALVAGALGLTAGQADAAYIPAVKDRTAINGYSFIDSQFKPNVASFFVTFKDFKERYKNKESTARLS